MIKFVLILSILLSTTACSKKKKNIAFYTSETVQEAESNGFQLDNKNSIEIPFRTENGNKYLSARINGHPFDMIFDTGCSDVLISAESARYLADLGALTESDINGRVLSKIADGSIVEGYSVTIKELNLADKVTFKNVNAQISSSSGAPMLLGNEVLDRVYKVTIDNYESVIILHVR